jgi:hypothetical protein
MGPLEGWRHPDVPYRHRALALALCKGDPVNFSVEMDFEIQALSQRGPEVMACPELTLDLISILKVPCRPFQFLS